MKYSHLIWSCIAVLSIAMGCDETIADRCLYDASKGDAYKQYFNGETCICAVPERQINENGECACGLDKEEIENENHATICICKDKSREINKDGDCVCHDDKHEDQSHKCVCNDNTRVIDETSGQCVCSADKHEDEITKKCVCNDNTRVINTNGECVCGFNQKEDKGQCVCIHSDQKINNEGNCECNDPYLVIHADGQCIKKDNAYLNDAAQWVCKPGFMLNESKDDCIKYGKDENNNHLIDDYEVLDSEDINKDCKSNDDCKSGFCDSFIGYKCSVKCTTNSQCIGTALKDGYNYVCRNDGRCAPDSFTTLWDIPNESNDMKTIAFYITKFDKISIDWGDNSKPYIYTCQSDKDYFCDANLVEKTSVKGWNELHKKDDTLSVGTRNNGEIKVIKLQHRYTNPGTYTVKISGAGVLDIGLNIDNSDGTLYNLLGVLAFGQVGIGNKFFANIKTSFFISSIDIPRSDLLTSLDHMFYNATSFNRDISHWDVSNVTNMEYAFLSAKSFNQDISHWNVSKVDKFHKMFYAASVFNQDISNWNIKDNADVGSMFTGTPWCTSSTNPHEKWGNVCAN